MVITFEIASKPSTFWPCWSLIWKMLVQAFLCFILAIKTLAHSSPKPIHSALLCYLTSNIAKWLVEIYWSLQLASFRINSWLVGSCCSRDCAWRRSFLTFACWLYMSANLLLFSCLKEYLKLFKMCCNAFKLDPLRCYDMLYLTTSLKSLSFVHIS